MNKEEKRIQDICKLFLKTLLTHLSDNGRNEEIKEVLRDWLVIKEKLKKILIKYK